MKLDSYTYKDKQYDFRLTMAAKSAVEELNFKIFEELENPEVMKMMNEIGDLQQRLADAKKVKDETLIETIKEEIEKVSLKNMSNMKSFIKLQQNAIDPVEISVILLMNDRRYKDDMTKEFAYEIMYAMEDEMDDFEKYNERLASIADKVFTMINHVQDRLTEIADKKERKEVVQDKKILN